MIPDHIMAEYREELRRHHHGIDGELHLARTRARVLAQWEISGWTYEARKQIEAELDAAEAEILGETA